MKRSIGFVLILQLALSVCASTSSATATAASTAGGAAAAASAASAASSPQGNGNYYGNNQGNGQGNNYGSNQGNGNGNNAHGSYPIDSSAAAAAAAAASGSGSGSSAAASAASAANNAQNVGSSSAASSAAASNANKGGSSAASAAAAAAAAGSSAASAAAAAAGGSAASTSSAAAAGNGNAAASSTAAASGRTSTTSSTSGEVQGSSQYAGSNQQGGSSGNGNDYGSDYGADFSNYHGPGGCNPVTEFIYQGACLPKSCLSQKLSKVRLTPVDAFNSNTGQLGFGILYNVRTVSTSSGNAYQVTIAYQDDKNNQLVSDPINCIDWRVYQTANSYDIDNTRQWISTSYGAVPSWPQSQYNFDPTTDSGQIQFIVTQGDLDNRKCLKLSTASVIQWQCFFELAFVVKQVTQISYYLCIQVQVNTGISYNTQTPAVNFLRIVQVDGCPPTSSACSVAVTVSSELLFCDGPACAQVSQGPLYPLYLNRPFWMLHRISDRTFQQNWLINSVMINYQAFGFSLTLGSTEFIVTKHEAGYNIYQLRVPIVSTQVVISVSGILSQSRRALADDSTQNVNKVSASQNTGEIKIDPDAMIAQINSTPSQQTLQQPVKGKISQNDGAILTIVGSAILYTLVY